MRLVTWIKAVPYITDMYDYYVQQSSKLFSNFIYMQKNKNMHST